MSNCTVGAKNTTGTVAQNAGAAAAAWCSCSFVYFSNEMTTLMYDTQGNALWRMFPEFSRMKTLIVTIIGIPPSEVVVDIRYGCA